MIVETRRDESVHQIERVLYRAISIGFAFEMRMLKQVAVQSMVMPFSSHFRCTAHVSTPIDLLRLPLHGPSQKRLYHWSRILLVSSFNTGCYSLRADVALCRRCWGRLMGRGESPTWTAVQYSDVHAQYPR